jgi:hypothetical protein
MPKDSAYSPWLEAARRMDEHYMGTAPPPDLIARAVLRELQKKRAPVVMREGSFFQAVIGPFGPRILPRGTLLESIRSHYGLTPIDAQNRERK